MAAAGSTGADHVPPWHRRGAGDGVHRRRALAAALLLILALVLLALPEVSPSSTAAQAASQVTYLPGQTPMNAPYSSGTTVGGVTCGANIRQVPWSAYASACQPKWTGNNGGATAPGVTPTTITLTYREAATSILQELYTLVPPAVVGTNALAIQTMQAYINVFNKDFELYGRHVVLTPFNGQGNFIDEDTGGGAPQAQADAITAASSLHAFADMSLVDSSVAYTQDLQAQKVVAFGLYQQDEQWYQQNAPWQYTPGPNCTKSAAAIAAIFGKQLKGETAQFAAGGLQNDPRKLGIFYPSPPTQHACEQALVQDLAQYGVSPVAQASLTFDISQLPSESATAVAQMKQAGATTIICVGCDPISPIYYFESATADNYHPEWFFQSLYAANTTAGESWIRLLPADQRDQIITAGTPETSNEEAEAVHAFELGNTTPGATIDPGFLLIYGSMIQFFDGLQAAGPNLTPSNLEAAMKAIPQSSPGGELGDWNGKDGPYDPASGFQILRFANDAVSPADGLKGTYEVCNDGTVYPYDDPASSLPASTPLVCKVTPQVPTGLGTVPDSGSTPTATTAPTATTSKQALGDAPTTSKARG